MLLAKLDVVLQGITQSDEPNTPAARELDLNASACGQMFRILRLHRLV